VKPIISETEVSYFLYEVSKRFPNSFLAGIICDKHGFLLAGVRKGKKAKIQMQENDLAMLAIARKRELKKDSRFFGVQKELNKSENIQLLVLLDKDNSKKNKNQFKELNSLISTQTLF